MVYIYSMIRKQLYLPKNYIDKTNKASGLQKVTFSEYVRRALATQLKKDGIEPPQDNAPFESAFEALEKIKKLKGKKAPSDLSSRVDYYMYIEPYERSQKKYSR